MIKVTSNAKAFSSQLLAAIEDIDRQLDEQFERWTFRVFKYLVYGTPQWSGDTAANWRYSIGSPSSEYSEIANKALGWNDDRKYRTDGWEPYQVMHHLAAEGAVSRANDGPKPRWRDKVFFTNNTPIAPDLDAEPKWLRPVNLVNGAQITVNYTKAFWSTMPV